MEEINTNYTIAEEYSLPSKAKIYEKPFDPHIKLKSMSVMDEMKRTNAVTNPHKTLCEIIDGCLITKLPYSTYDLCMGDYEYLLHKLRIVTYGPDYKMLVGCPHCDSVHEEVINLDDLKIREFDMKDFEAARTFELPISKKSVTISYQTPRLLDQIEAKVKEFKKKNPKASYDPTTLITLQYMIESVDGEPLSYAETEPFITNLSARDGNFILNKISKLNSLIGLDTEVDVVCHGCGGDIKTFFRFGQEFFRPTND